ncbi:Hypothetical protein mma_1626 [Janthinobacterium sp. Marseille]|nr:hypothetical protein [Janthinobacterium sp. Marseille]ABR91178.1 Hypothetical protein mma_1626 [Janthinobacterium sp. Marseille]
MKTSHTAIAVSNEDGTMRVLHPLLASRSRRLTHWLAMQLGVERPHEAGLWLQRIFIRPKKAVTLNIHQVPDPLHLLGLRFNLKNQHAKALRGRDKLSFQPASSKSTESEQRFVA